MSEVNAFEMGVPRDDLTCPFCGSATYRNEGGLYICTNRNCPKKWRSYSSEPLPPPQREKEPKLDTGVSSLAAAVTSNQQYIKTLRGTLDYKSDKQIYRLRKRLGDILTENYSGGITITFHPAGGTQRIPAPPRVDDLLISTPVRIKETHFSSELQHPYAVLNIDPAMSGQPLVVQYSLRD